MAAGSGGFGQVEQDWDGLDTKVFVSVSVPYVASVHESGIGTT